MSPANQLSRFLARYDPPIVRLTNEILRKMRSRVPGAVELVYDNYNALVIGFGPTERAGDAVFSIVVYPRWVTLFFLSGASLPDPRRVLRGNGKVVRQVRLTSAANLDEPALVELMETALARCDIDFPARRRLVIKSISPVQRPRRPAGTSVTGKKKPKSRRKTRKGIST
jgi:hypothetical protein